MPPVPMVFSGGGIENLEKVAIRGPLPLKPARRDAIAKLKSFGGFEYELQTNPMQFHLDSLWGATLCRLEHVRWTGDGTGW